MSSANIEKTVDPKQQFRARIGFSLLVLLSVILMLSVGSVVSVFAQASEGAATISPEKAQVMKFGMIAAAVAFGFGAIGAGIAIAHVGAAAMGAIGEKPEVAGQALIFVALGEGVVIFGFITAIMILGKIPA